jgi:hypothetical protein
MENLPMTGLDLIRWNRWNRWNRWEGNGSWHPTATAFPLQVQTLHQILFLGGAADQLHRPSKYIFPEKWREKKNAQILEVLG